MPVPPRAAISNDDEVRPAAPMSWIATIASVLHQLQAGFQQQLLGERIADLDGRAPRLGSLAELGRSHRRAMDAIAPGLGADVDHRIADASGAGVKDLVLSARGPTHIALTRMLPS